MFKKSGSRLRLSTRLMGVSAIVCVALIAPIAGNNNQAHAMECTNSGDPFTWPSDDQGHFSNTACGDLAGVGSTLTNRNNSSFGESAGTSVVGNRNIAVGSRAGRNVGVAAGGVDGSISIGTDEDGDFVGAQADAINAIAIGTDATVLNGGDNSIALGAGASATGANAVAVGAGVTAATNQIVIGTAANNVYADGINTTISLPGDGLVAIDPISGLLVRSNVTLNGTGGLDLGNGGLTNTGAIAGATTIDASGNITTTATVQGATITDGTATLTGGNLTGINTLAANTGNITTVNATDVNTTNVTATGTVSANTLTANTGNITTVNATNVNTTNVTATGTVSANTLAANTGNITTVNATNVNTTNVTATGTVSANTLTANTGNITTVNATTVNATQANVSGLAMAPASTIDMGGNRVRNVTTPVAGTDATNKNYVDGLNATTNARIDENEEGIAMAIALDSPYVPKDQSFALRGRFGHYKGDTALGVSGAARLNENLQFDIGVSFGVKHANVAAGGGMTLSW